MHKLKCLSKKTEIVEPCVHWTSAEKTLECSEHGHWGLV